MQDSLCPGTSAEASTYTGHNRDGETMPTLTDEIKAFIVISLARYEAAAQVVEAVKSTFDVALTRRHVYAYDPRCPQPPAPRWRELHAATREAYVREVAEIGVAQKAVRLAMLDRMAHHALANNYTINAAAFLKQAAKECGGVYESRKPASPTTIVSLTTVSPVGSESPSAAVSEPDAPAITIRDRSVPESPSALAPAPR